MKFQGQTALVIGAKRSGLAATGLLRASGAHVRVMDERAPSIEERLKFDELRASVVRQNEENLKENGRFPDLIVLSPGVPADLALLRPLREAGVPVIGEVELASYFLRGPVIGITGSNGKTTTTALTGHLLKECGIPCQVGGNIGTAVTSLISSSSDKQWNVLELSSFQLETISQFRAEIAACLNLTPDHLDRHHTFEGYVSAKRRLFETQQANDAAVLNYDDPACRAFAEHAIARVWWFSSRTRVPAGMWLEDGTVLFEGEPFLERAQIKLRGLHNVENVMAAALMAHLAGAGLTDLPRAIETFPGVEHRIEFVRELHGVEYFNDSKATNVDATLKALDAFPRNLWVILGGKDKGSDYTPLREPLHTRAKAALLIGAEPPYPYAAAPIMRRELAGAVQLVDCGTLDAAVHYAHAQAAKGDVVLLAPACASFDQFESYEHRGRTFKQIVSELF